MVISSFSLLFEVIAESAAALIGLMFVAVTVVKRGSESGSAEMGEFRAAASLLAFTNALVVSVFGCPAMASVTPRSSWVSLAYSSLAPGCARRSPKHLNERTADTRCP